MKKPKEHGQKEMFLRDLADSLGVRKNKLEKLNKKIEQITSEKEISKKHYLTKAKKLIELIFLKHHEIGKKAFLLTDKQEQEKALLEELQTMFNMDYIFED